MTKIGIEITIELEPCGHCGSTDLELCNTHTPSFWVECQECGAQAHGEYFEGDPVGEGQPWHYSPNPDGYHYEADLLGLPENYQRAALSAVAAWNRRTPALEAVPDWSTAPAWAMWWAVDASGEWFWHQVEPIMHQTVSACTWDVGCWDGVPQGDWVFGGHIDIPLGIDWRTLKRQRPKQEPTP